ncbi:hypothetical protein [Phytoactinopolyspora alkaliphila]|uniref:hypothetical protein n=1 Tax=Phytoactinopolyspora alkaliphila TaxID=1783498 RepID=UPI0013D66DE5|nr:hypothetical protein [Phytoactinopolyspora alkaliphila]
MTTIVIFLTSSAFLLAGVALPAAASNQPPDFECPDGHRWTGFGCEPEDDDTDRERTGCDQADPTVMNIPCRFGPFVWHQPHDSYLRALTQQEAAEFRDDGIYGCSGCLYDGLWQDYPLGWIYEWRKISGIIPPSDPVWGQVGFIWLADDPLGPPPVDPAALAQQILDDMDLQPIEIGMAPAPIDQRPDSLGLVGAPVWLWAVDPSPQTWGPVEDSMSEGGITVTVTAAVEEASWDTGDGSIRTCTDPGTAYRESLGVRESPNCGHTYQQTSRQHPDQAFTVTATTHWAASWEASTGESGTLDVDPLTSTARVRIGERQLIEQE